MYFRIDDEVQVIAGAGKATNARGKILKIDRKNNKVVVEGVAKVWKHVRRSQKNPQGGRLSKEMPIDVSNVKVIAAAGAEATRIGYRFTEDGTKERYAIVDGRNKKGPSLGSV